jgi:hypothetical protein
MNKKKYKNQISVATNAHHFFLHSVIIIKEGEHKFRLVVRSRNNVSSFTYEKLRGARIAFSRYFQYLAYQDGIKAEWTAPFYPDPKFMKQFKLSNEQGRNNE